MVYVFPGSLHDGGQRLEYAECIADGGHVKWLRWRLRALGNGRATYTAGHEEPARRSRTATLLTD